MVARPLRNEMPMPAWSFAVFSAVRTGPRRYVRGLNRLIGLKSGTWRYIRVKGRSGGNGGKYGVSEVVLAEKKGGPNKANKPEKALASAEDVGFEAANAFDGDISADNAWTTSSQPGQWIGYDFGSPKTIVEVRLRARDDASFAQIIQDFDVEGSNDLVSWELIWQERGTGSYTQGEEKAFADPATETPVTPDTISVEELRVYAILGRYIDGATLNTMSPAVVFGAPVGVAALSGMSINVIIDES